MEDTEGKRLENATVYCTPEQKDGKSFNVIKFVHYKKNNTWYKNIQTDPETKATLEKIEGTPDEEERKKLKQLEISFEPSLLEAAAFLSYLSNEAETMLASDDENSPKKKDATSTPSVGPTGGIGAGSGPAGNSSVNGYSLHKWMDKCREEINAKLNSAGHSLPKDKYDLVATDDSHKMTIQDDAKMAADLKPIDSMSEQEFADFICKDLKAYVNMFIAMHEKHPDVVFPPNKINLFVIKKEINTPEGKAKIEKIEQLVAKQMHAFLNDPKIPNDVKSHFTILGRTLKQGPAGPAPTPAPAPTATPPAPPAPPVPPVPSAPPASTDENTPPGTGSKKLDLSKKDGPDAPPAAVPPADSGSKPGSPRK